MQARAAAFAREQVIPAIDGWERDGRYPRAVVAASGLTGLFCPAEVGGAALSYPDGMAVFEELGRGDAALAFSLSMHNAVAAAVAGHAELAERWARALAAGDALGGFSLTEPHAGSDATAITTRAEPDGERLARDRAQGVGVAGRRGRPVPGRVQDVGRAGPPRHRDRGRRRGRAPACRSPSSTARRAPTSCRSARWSSTAPPARCWRPPGAGMRAALGAIDVARCDIAAIAAGLHAEALDTAVRYAAERQAFGAPLLDLEPLRFALADVATDLEASRLLYRQAAERLGTADGPVAVAHAKRFCPDAALSAAIACSEVLGAYGWLLDHPLRADDRARQDAPGGRRDGRDPARRDRPGACVPSRPGASCRSPRG